MNNYLVQMFIKHAIVRERRIISGLVPIKVITLSLLIDDLAFSVIILF